MIFNELNSLEYIESKNNKRSIGIVKLREFLDRIGSPDEKLSFIHIAGTNGKGSTSTFTASILAMAGKKVGLFTSPYFERFGERIRIIDGSEDCLNWKNDSSHGEINSKALAETLNYLYQQCEEYGYKLDDFSHFETLVCLALLHFLAKKVEVVVWETGLGGKLDATNIIREAKVVVLTSIAYDHCDKLGFTLEEISREKVAIIKEKSKVILYNPNDSLISSSDANTVLKIVRERCKEKKVPLVIVSASDYTLIKKSQDGQKFKLSFYPHNLHTSSLAEYQLQNIAMAVSVATTYDNNLFVAKSTLSEDPIVRAIAITKIPGRFELLHNKPDIILDAAHNPLAIEKFLNSLIEVYGKRKIYFIFSAMKDKDYKKSLEIILNKENLNLDKLFLTQINYFRAAGLNELHNTALSLNRIKSHQSDLTVHSEPKAIDSKEFNTSEKLTDDMNSIFKILDIEINEEHKMESSEKLDDLLNIVEMKKGELGINRENTEYRNFLNNGKRKDSTCKEVQIDTINISDKVATVNLLKMAEAERAVIVVCGSFYLISEFKKNFNLWFRD